MENTMIENNVVTIGGRIVSDFSYSHDFFGERFFMIDVEVKRISENIDVIPVMVSERLIDVNGNYAGMLVSVQGQFRSYNKYTDGRNRLVLSVFAREIEFLEEERGRSENNKIFLDGYICKEPIYRKTPLGREIADLLLAVNRSYGKTDYIPCICWGRNARYAALQKIGQRMKLWGRIQRREYIKKTSEDEFDKRVAYEMSVSKMSEGDVDDAGEE